MLSRFPALALLTLGAVACSSNPEPNTPGNAGGSGGNSGSASSAGTPSTSGASGTGQSGGGQGGAGQSGAAGQNGAGQSGAGGSIGGGGAGGSGGGGAGTGFKCPPGSEAIVPTIPSTAGSAIANVPPAGFDPDNLEGPVWINGYLYLSEIAKRSGPADPQGGRIIRYQPGGTATPFLLDVGTNGLAVNAAGELVAASQKVGGIVSFDISGASPSSTPKTIYADEFNDMGADKRFSSPNDLTLRSDGNIYFTDPDYQSGSVKQSAQRTYRVAPDGMVTAIAGAPSPPNGITLSPDENTLYVGGAKLMKYAVKADGSVEAGADFGSQSGTDGLGVDCAGNLYVAKYNDGNVVVLSPSGSPLGTITVGSGVTNIAFGGPDSKTLFITRMTPPSLYAVTMNIPGFPY